MTPNAATNPSTTPAYKGPPLHEKNKENLRKLVLGELLSNPTQLQRFTVRILLSAIQDYTPWREAFGEALREVKPPHLPANENEAFRLLVETFEALPFLTPVEPTPPQNPAPTNPTLDCEYIKSALYGEEPRVEERASRFKNP